MIPDEIIPNVRFLSDRVDDIEIVLVETGEFSNIPSTEIVRGLKSLAADHDLTYTVHLPIDIHTGHADAGERRRAASPNGGTGVQRWPSRPRLHLCHDRCPQGNP